MPQPLAEPKTALGAELRRVRTLLGVSQRVIAERLHVSPAMVSLWEVGREVPRQEMLSGYFALFPGTTEDKRTAYAHWIELAGYGLGDIGEGAMDDADYPEVEIVARIFRGIDDPGERQELLRLVLNMRHTQLTLHGQVRISEDQSVAAPGPSDRPDSVE